MAEKNTFYGGQAVIEGVMMRGKHHVVTAVRHPNGQIGIHSQPLAALYKGRLRKTPFIRGVIAMIESMVLGIQTLMLSANIALEEENVKLSPLQTFGIIASALAFSVFVFFLIPLFATNFFRDLIPNAVVFNLVEGVFRVLLFVGYLAVVSLMKDIKRVFAYHGAEHKAINTFEAGEPLEIEYARKYTTANPRCGTSFLFFVLIIAIFVFSIIGKPALVYMVLSRVLLLPVIAGISYELIFYTARHCDNPVVKMLMKPGLWMQSLSTRKPDDEQLEVALEALKNVIALEKEEAEEKIEVPIGERVPAA